MTPEQLFILYYLGISPEGTYRFVNANQVARLLNWTPEQLQETLKKNGMAPAAVLNLDFPLARHQVDLQMEALEIPPEKLLARAFEVYQAWRKAAGSSKKRDWLKEIREEQEADRESAIRRKMEQAQKQENQDWEREQDEEACRKANELPPVARPPDDED
ncbi:MAG: hypothetical protein OEW12_00750 [Deltaproteobacteria bacterium]|nr:hypothetical protein [Deltaproteobacteria bacterium]